MMGQVEAAVSKAPRADSRVGIREGVSKDLGEERVAKLRPGREGGIEGERDGVEGARKSPG